MSKDAFWFKHDSNASRDLRLMQIKAIYGLEGLGVFWSIVEVLREQKGYKWEEKQVNILAKIIDCDVQKLNNFLTDCKRISLFSFENGHIFSNRLIKDMKVWESKKKNRTKEERNENENGTDEEHKRREEERREDIRYIINHLNSVSGSKYRESTKATKHHIEARLNEKFSREDFKKVIDIKSSQWLADPQMQKYLRPETLFGTKFESYLNEWKEPKKIEPPKEVPKDFFKVND